MNMKMHVGNGELIIGAIGFLLGIAALVGFIYFVFWGF